MTVELKLTAQKRTDVGKGASRRLRHAKKLPAVLYGGNEDVVLLQLDAPQVNRLLEEEAFYSQILTLEIDGKAQSAVLKDMQRHPFKPVVLHMDLQRVKAGTKMRAHIPLHFLNQEDVARATGGIVHHDMIEVEVECLPKNLPQFIEVDVKGLKLGDALHLSDLKLPKGVTLPELAHGPEHDLPVVSIAGKRGPSADESEGEGGEEAAE